MVRGLVFLRHASPMIGNSSDRKSVFHVGLHSRYRERMTHTRFNGSMPRWIGPCLGLGLTILAMIGLHFLEKRASRGFVRSAS